MSHVRAASLALAAALAAAGCDDVESPDEINDNELITTVVLAATPLGGGPSSTFRWADPEGDGDPTIDAISLSDADDYALEVSFLNELERPPEDLTEEVRAESDQHQVFFSGTAVGAVISHAYDDSDDNGFPIGLASTIATIAPGAGTLTVTLRHLPPEGGEAVKTGDLAERAAANGLEALPGDTDVEVSFEIEVLPAR